MRFKMDLKIIFSTIFITVAICSLTMADKTTAERIRKHQEWLKQRNHGRNHLLSTAKPKKSIELLNLWRFNKNENENSINDVYPENDNILSKTTTTATAIANINVTTTTTMPEVTTTKTTLPAATFTTSSTTTTTTQQPTAYVSTATTTTLKPAAVAPFYNSIARFDSNFHLKSSNTSEWLSNDILETTTPFTTTISTSAAPAIISTTATTTTSTSTTLATTTTTTTAATRKAKQRPYPRWGNWGEWSDCSRSCGGGIKHQLRKCINRNSSTGKLHLSKNCIGVYKRYQLCNEQPCPSHQEDFRALQCSSYNNVAFQGQQFLWEPYVKDDAECELNCKPLGMKYFATLNSTVIDGTSCEKPAEYYRSHYKGRAMCIDGICKTTLVHGEIIERMCFFLVSFESGELYVAESNKIHFESESDCVVKVKGGRYVARVILKSAVRKTTRRKWTQEEQDAIYSIFRNVKALEKLPTSMQCVDAITTQVALQSRTPEQLKSWIDNQMRYEKAIHASGIITGLSANSGAVSCGGLLCRPITGLFTRDPLPDDAYIHVATIPAGASNISITELKNSMNLLVLNTDDDSYIINGDNTVSESGAYEAAGAVFDYHRLDVLQEHGEGVTEWVTCTGPLRDNVELMIYSKTVNPGIKYEYLLPITSDSEENEVSLESDGFLKSGSEDVSASVNHSSKRRRFNWKVVGFSTCSKSCGGGTQSPIIRCVRENPLRYYSQRRCTQSEKPVINENLLRCNTQPCPAYWRLDDWAECRCHHGEGFKERELSCVQELASGIVIHVDNSACMEEKPVVKKPCDCPKNRRRSNQRYRLHGLSSNGSHSLVRRNERAGTWLMSDWNQYCSTDCGAGVEYRTIYCDRSKPNSDRCDFRTTPEITRSCERTQICEAGEWFSGPWSPCNGNCFNLTRTRQVLCIQSQLIVEDEDCKPELRPANAEKCSHEEVEYCGPRWHYSEWSECTKTCNTGTQRRSVKCLEYDNHDNALRESNKCRYSIREPIYRSCNTHKCEENRADRAQNDGALISCLDEIANCQWAVKAKLCNYEYYQHKCCYSCGKAR